LQPRARRHKRLAAALVVTVLITETVTEPHVSLAAGSSKVRLPTPHSLVLFPKHVMSGGLVSLTVMAWTQVALLPH